MIIFYENKWIQVKNVDKIEPFSQENVIFRSYYYFFYQMQK